MNMSDLSLMSILSGQCKADPAFAKKIQQVKTTKETILKTAVKLNEVHKEEIADGTRKRQLMLEEGKKRGLVDDEDIFKGNELFFPTQETPILNFCYYITRDIDKNLKVLTETYNKKYGLLEHEQRAEDTGKVLPDLGKYLFENITIDTFNKMKKLKSMSKGGNENEAFQAYRKLNELCKKYNLDADKIPTENSGRPDSF